MLHWSLCDSLLCFVVILHLSFAPFTKVEESFNLQAIHDILTFGILDISQYDHNSFPGAVPRTFIASLIIAAIVWPFKFVWLAFNDTVDRLPIQFMVRLTIGMTNALGFIYLKSCLQYHMDDITLKEQEKDKTDNVNTFSTVGNWFIICCASSFHLMFYSSRPLPNFIITLPLVNIALGWCLLDQFKWGVCLLAFTAVIFRLEVAAFCIGIALASIWYKKLNWFQTLKFGLMGAFLGIGLSITVDSFFWSDYTLPELDAFIFNIVSGNSKNWGVEPFYAYFTNYLRLLFLPPTFLLLNYLGFKLASNNVKIITLAGYFHILLLSFQPHKEWRFIVYSIPTIFILGAIAAAYIWENVKVQSLMQALYLFILPFSILVAFICSFFFLKVSMENYPGGHALHQLNQYIMTNNITNSTVHMSIPPCMTGISRFGELNYDTFGIIYDKTEQIDNLKLNWHNFEFLITHESDPERFIVPSVSDDEWELIDETAMFTHLDLIYVNELLDSFTLNYKDMQISSILYQHGKKIPEFIIQLITGGEARNFFNIIFDKTFVKEPVFYTFRRRLETAAV